jgi:hypothetical protein
MVALAATGCRFFIGAIFLFAGLAKIGRRAEFAQAVERYDLLPSRLVRPVATWLPRLELIVGALLTGGLGIVYASAAVAGVLTIFSLAIAVNLLRGRTFDCGCVAVGAPRKIGWASVSRNGVLTAMAVLAAAEAPSTLSLDALLPGRTSGSVGTGDAFALLLVAPMLVLALTLVHEAHSVRSAIRAREGGGA